MSTYNQAKPNVTYAFDSGSAINFGAIRSGNDLASEIEKLRLELTKAREGNAIDANAETSTRSYLLHAATEAKAPKPDKEVLIAHLNEARTRLRGLTAVHRIASAIGQATDLVRGSF